MHERQSAFREARRVARDRGGNKSERRVFLSGALQADGEVDRSFCAVRWNTEEQWQKSMLTIKV